MPGEERSIGPKDAGIKKPQKHLLNMKNLTATITFLFLTLISVRNISAQESAASLYNEGNRLYREGRYQESVEKYELITAMGVHNSRVYYNLGNAYFRLGKIGKAILAYERAKRLSPGDEDILANLEFVNMLKSDKPSASDTNPLIYFLRLLRDLFSPDELALAFSFALFAVAALLSLAIIRGRIGTRIAAIAIVLVVICIFSGTLLAFSAHSLRPGDAAVVMAEEIDAMSGPAEDYIKIFTLHEGTKVYIQRYSEDWVLIRLENGLGGWVRGEAMEVI